MALTSYPYPRGQRERETERPTRIATSVGLGIAKQGTGRQEPQAGTRTQAMNVDREDELRIQAPPRGSVSQ